MSRNGAVRLTSSACRHSYTVNCSAQRGQWQCGIVDQDVDPPEAIEGATSNLLQHTADRQIALDCERTFTDFVRDRLGPLAITHVHCNRRAALVKSRSHRTPQAPRGAGDDRHATPEVILVHPAALTRRVPFMR